VVGTQVGRWWVPGWVHLGGYRVGYRGGVLLPGYPGYLPQPGTLMLARVTREVQPGWVSSQEVQPGGPARVGVQPGGPARVGQPAGVGTTAALLVLNTGLRTL